ncbi:hypothetical protein ACQKLP_15060 [Chitinophaga sp. NPDC101104]|uniref:hypothetical protein n=1 Tax=Chitinophaga sp. NPDC101104 TaxID=3390561 RepID=UPI003CFF44F1
MPCNLLIRGENFDVDLFVEQTGIPPYEITRKGEQTGASRLQKKTMHLSTLHYIVSEANFDDHKTQIANALTFFRTHGEQLAKYATSANIDYTYLDFGMDDHIGYNIICKTFEFPAELLQYLAAIKCDLLVGIYRSNE